MEVLSIKRTTSRDSKLKVYGKILGDKGIVYSFAYFRSKFFRGWTCTCDNFILSQMAKKRNCKHLHEVRSLYGRYGAQVPKSQPVATA
jgi:hypothetical protein